MVKDDIVGLPINKELVEGSEHPRTVPPGYKYEVPLSLHAETCLSEYKVKEKSNTSGKVKSIQVVNMLADFADNSDKLYNAYADAQRGKEVLKKIRRMKSVSPPRPSKVPTRTLRSPPRNRVITTAT